MPKLPETKMVTETKVPDRLDVSEPDVDTEVGEGDAETTVKSPGVNQGIALIYRKEQCLAWAAQVFQGTMADSTTVVQSAKTYYEWLTSD